MPTYAYQCKACEHQFETVQKMTDEPLKQCPKCKGEIARILFAPGIVFKGSGFHVNDYPSSRSSTSSNTAKSESSTEPKVEPKTDTVAATKS